MGEIRSTLDLVMERTSHLQFSGDERRQQLEKEARAKTRGLLQKLADQALRPDHFADDYRRLKTEYGLDDDAILIAECLEQLAIGADNAPMLSAMDSAGGVDRAAIESVIGHFQDRDRETAAAAKRRALDDLATRLHISGSAVVPNLSRDDRWRQERAVLEDEFRQKLAEAAGSAGAK